MILVTDSNIIYSALINPNGVIAKIFKDKADIQFIAPDYLFQEVKNHWDKIVMASSLTEKELKAEFDFYKKRIKIYAKGVSRKAFNKAYEIVKDIDENDMLFVALHLQTGHKLWTGDKELIKGVTAKGYDIFITTEELKKKLYRKA